MTAIDPFAPTADPVMDGSDASFMQDVVEASKSLPVIVDFWAPWCGPCRTLTPAIEKAVRAAKGAVKLVKINVDENPAFAGQLRVQSIPTVYAFRDGQPVDGFQGAIPESQLTAFVERLSGQRSAAADVEAILAMGEESLGLNDLGGAAQAFAEALQLDPANERAIAGMAMVYLADGDAGQARQTIAMAPDPSKEPLVQSVRARLALAEQAPSGVGDTAALEAAVKADAGDHQARFDLAQALAAAGRLDEAVEALLHIVRADRDWNDQAARKQLLTLFEAAGAASPLAREGRRKLSSILFA